jgi:DNA-binding Lrp family transcriptional regulator
VANTNMARPKATTATGRVRKKAAPRQVGAPEVATASVSTSRRRSHRMRDELDGADRQIIELLSQDGRLSNRALAAVIGLTEATVAARIRMLTERRVLGVTAVLDWQAAGYDWDVWLDVEVEVGARSVVEVGDELAAVPGVHSVQTVFGPVDLVVHALLSGREEAVEFISERISAVSGVRRARPNVALETVKYAVRYARLPVAPGDLRLPAPRVELDGLDFSIVKALVRDGRQSNRAIGRELGTSEGTVRVRLRRLEDAGLLRIVGQSDPYLAGLVNAWAYIWVDVEAGKLRSVSVRIAAMPEVTIVAITAGSHDILVAAATLTRTRLVELVAQDIRSVEGVRTTQTWEVAHTTRLNYQWARLV